MLVSYELDGAFEIFADQPEDATTAPWIDMHLLRGHTHLIARPLAMRARGHTVQELRSLNAPELAPESRLPVPANCDVDGEPSADHLEWIDTNLPQASPLGICSLARCEASQPESLYVRARPLIQGKDPLRAVLDPDIVFIRLQPLASSLPAGLEIF
jgi:hypothetical protein